MAENFRFKNNITIVQMNNKIKLGLKALDNAINFNWAPEFNFVFKNKKGNLITTIQSNSIHACLISSKVYRAFLSDPTIYEMVFNVDDKITKDHLENYFKNIKSGLDDCAKNYIYYLKIAELIETQDVIDEIMKLNKTQTPIDSNNIIKKILLKQNANTNYDDEIKYAAKNMTILIQENAFDDCPNENKIDILTSILSVYNTQQANERDMEIIFDFVEDFEDNDFIKLISLLNPKFISPDLIGRALRRITTENITDDFLTFLHSRFDSGAKKLAEKIIECKHSNGSLNGIFSELKARCGKNPVDTNDIQITTPGIIKSKTELKNIIDAGDKVGVIITAKSKDYTKIIFDFGDNKKVSLTGYELKVRGEQNQYNFPKSWIISGSNDKNTFVPIDIKYNYNDFSPGKVKYFIVSKKSENYRYIEYFQTSNHGNPNEQKHLRLSSIEFYGSLVYH